MLYLRSAIVINLMSFYYKLAIEKKHAKRILNRIQIKLKKKTTNYSKKKIYLFIGKV